MGVLTAARPSANIRDKPRPHGPGPANRRKASRREGGNVTTPSTGELLVKEAKSAERLEIMAMAEKAATIEDFRKALEERHNASK